MMDVASIKKESTLYRRISHVPHMEGNFVVDENLRYKLA